MLISFSEELGIWNELQGGYGIFFPGGLLQQARYPSVRDGLGVVLSEAWKVAYLNSCDLFQAYNSMLLHHFMA